MSTDIADNSTQSVKRPRLQFSLLAVLLFITLVCIALGYAFRTRYCVATTLFRVSSQKPALWGDDAGQFDAREFEIFQNTQVSLIQSNAVLQSAVRHPAIASLPILAGEDDPVAWISERIEAGFPGNDEILTICLRGNRVHADQLRQIVDAVAKSYVDVAIVTERETQLRKRDSISRQLTKIKDKLAIKLNELQKTKAEAGPDAVDVTIRQREVDTLMDLVRELGRRLEIEFLNTSSPEQTERIQKIQPAVVVFE